MGGSSSAPKRVTLEQEDGSGAIKVSEAVARRLVGKPEAADSAVVHTGPALSQAGSDEEIAIMQKKYEKRVKALEKQNKELHQTTTEQFAKAVEEVEQKFLKTTAAPICDDLQNEVMKCYQDNPKQSLVCSQIVKAYSSCVQQQRESILTRKEECKPCLLAQMARGPCGMHFMKAYDCYLEERDPDECGNMYLEMKECWEKHPNFGYQTIIDKAYSPDEPSPVSKSDKTNKDNSLDKGSKQAEKPTDTGVEERKKA